MRLPASLRLVALLLAGCVAPRAPGGPAAAGPGEAPAPAPFARAFRLTSEAQTIGGAGAEGAVGDYRLENERLVAIIDDLPHARGFADSGGHVIDLGLRGRGGDQLVQIVTALGDQFPRQAIYAAIEAGSDGEGAFVRARGHDSGAPELEVTTEYRLAPGDRALRIATTIHNGGAAALAGYAVGDIVQWGRAEHFAPGVGTRLKGRRELPWLAGVGEELAYGYCAPGGRLLGGTHGTTWSDPVVAAVDVAPGASARIERHVVVGERGDVASVLPECLRRRGDASGVVRGVAREGSGGPPIPAAELLLSTVDGAPWATAIAGPDGRYEIAATPGEYLLAAAGGGRLAVAEVRVQIAAGTIGTADLPLTAPGRLRFELLDEASGAPSPGRITVLGVAPTPDPRFGPGHAGRGAANVSITATGRGELLIPPGRYRVVASRGLEFDVASAEVAVAAGAVTRFRGALRRSVDTHGYVSADFHQHAAPSSDSAVSLVDRVVSNLAEGVEVLVATDHDVITDYQPTIDALGLKGRLLAIPGDEATTHSVGHFIGFPMRRDPARRDGGAFRAEGKRPDAIFAALRADGLDKVIQVNHPRVDLGGGYFEAIGYDPAAMTLPQGFVAGFDAVEVINGKRVAEAERTLEDWFGLLDRGLAVTGVGNSDTHLIAGQEVGYPRNYVAVPDDDPAKVRVEDIVHGVKVARDVVVTNGPFLRATLEGQPIGARVTARRGVVQLDLEIQAAPWVGLDRIEILANGEPAHRPIELTPSPSPLRFKSAVPIDVRRGDAWIVVIVRGSTPLDPVVPRGAGGPVTAVALTNPWFVDADGDGRYTPAGPRAGRRPAPPPPRRRRRGRRR